MFRAAPNSLRKNLRLRLRRLNGEKLFVPVHYVIMHFFLDDSSNRCVSKVAESVNICCLKMELDLLFHLLLGMLVHT